MSSFKAIFTCAVLATAQIAAGHSIITGATGNAGGQGMALGVDSSTPRDGTRRQPFQQDATRFRGASAQTFGETLQGGSNDLEAGTAKIMAETGSQLPQVTAGGEISMDLHQVNSDGAGPYTCSISADASGTSWAPIQVTQDVPGSARGRNRDGEMQDFVLKAAIPQDQQCTGTVSGQNNVCLVRCENPANAGPFGGIVPVQMAAPGSAPAPGGAVPVTPSPAPAPAPATRMRRGKRAVFNA